MLPDASERVAAQILREVQYGIFVLVACLVGVVIFVGLLVAHHEGYALLRLDLEMWIPLAFIVGWKSLGWVGLPLLLFILLMETWALLRRACLRHNACPPGLRPLVRL